MNARALVYGMAILAVGCEQKAERGRTTEGVKAMAGKVDTRGVEKAIADRELATLAEDAYIYGYPLAIMDVTAHVATNVPAPEPPRFGAPFNQLDRVTTLPDATFRAVVRPNLDTLYALAFLDLAKQPVVLHVPDTKGRYYLMPMCDAYTNVFASPGKRTTGTTEHNFAVVGPGWNGTLPAGVDRIDAPTNLVWLLGRIQINGKDDLPGVAALVKQFSLTPLSSFGKPYTPPRNDTLDPNLDMVTPPPRQVAQWDDKAYFNRLAALMKAQPAPAADRDALLRFERIGLTPGRFEPSADASKAIQGVGQRALKRIQDHMTELGRNVNGWRIDTNLGSYGTRYLDRATIALIGPGTNLPQDAVYPITSVDAKGQPLDGAHRYTLHFDKGQEPPVNAFWSITMYDQPGYLVANPINRFALNSQDKMRRNADGSLDIAIQNEAPKGDMAANWLPAPKGPFNLTLRMYWPKEAALNGTWVMAGVQESATTPAPIAPPGLLPRGGGGPTP